MLNTNKQVPIVVVEIKNGSNKMTNSISTSNVKVLNYSEELERMNKVKYNLSVVYFAAVTIMMTTLFI